MTVVGKNNHVHVDEDGSVPPPQDPNGRGHLWVLGSSSSRTLVEHLWNVSRAAAASAVEKSGCATADDALMAATCVGLAFESLLKHSIAEENPALLAERGGESAVLLHRSGTSPVDLKRLKTVGGLEALSIFKQLHGELRGMPTIEQCIQLLSVRNSAVHMGIVDPADVRKALRTLVALVDVVEEHHDRYEFWTHEQQEFADALLNESANEARIALAEKRAAAARTLEQLTERIPFGGAEQVFQAIELKVRHLDNGVNVVAHRCPVCEREGALHRYVTDSNTDFTGYSERDAPSGIRYAYPELFECLVCGLELDEAEIAEEPAFEDVGEVELEPSEAFLDALADWRHERELERIREEWGRWD